MAAAVRLRCVALRNGMLGNEHYSAGALAGGDIITSSHEKLAQPAHSVYDEISQGARESARLGIYDVILTERILVVIES